jgi:hypothetical protein
MAIRNAVAAQLGWVSPEVVPYQNSPFFVSAIDTVPFFRLGVPADLTPGFPDLPDFA